MADSSSSSKGSNFNSNSRRTKQGRRTIELKPITREEARQVCFSKRRGGIIKKAGELCILCRAHVLIIVFSPAGKAFSFGDPFIDGIIQRFVDPASYVPSLPDARRMDALKEMHQQHEDLTERLDAEKKRHAQLKREMQSASVGELAHLWDADVNDLTPEQVLQLIQALHGMQAVLGKRETDLMNGTAVAMQHEPTTLDHHLPAAAFDQGWLVGSASGAANNLIPGHFAGPSPSNNCNDNLQSGGSAGPSNQHGTEGADYYLNPHNPSTTTHIAPSFYHGGPSGSSPGTSFSLFDDDQDS